MTTDELIAFLQKHPDVPVLLWNGEARAFFSITSVAVCEVQNGQRFVAIRAVSDQETVATQDLRAGPSYADPHPAPTNAEIEQMMRDNPGET